MPQASLAVPVMCNVGEKERQDRFAKLWERTFAFFRDFRAKGALVGFAPDPRTSHECGDDNTNRAPGGGSPTVRRQFQDSRVFSVE